MGLRYKNQSICNCFFVTTSYKKHKPYGEFPGFNNALTSELIFYLNKYDAKLAGYVFMPTHIHLLLFIDGKELSNFMRDFKKYVAQKVAPQFNIPGKNLWQSRFDRVAIISETVFITKLEYIHNNPAKDRLVDKADDWRWSCA